LCLCALIPIVNLLVLPGFAVRVFRNKFSLGDWGELVIDSVKALIIIVVYLIIPAIIDWLIMVLLTPLLMIGFARYYVNVYEFA